MFSIVNKKEKEKRNDIISHIYDEYYCWLITRANKTIKDKSICNDLFNDCVIGWIRNINTLEHLSESELRAYIVKSIDNACKQYIRKSSKTLISLDDDGGMMIDVEDNLQNVEELIEKKYNYETMKKAMSELTEKEQYIIYMKYNLRMKDKEMAPILDIKEDSVRMTVRRCVWKLQKIMKKEMGRDE